MKILLNDTAALVVDYQERLLPVIDGREQLLQKSAVLLEGLKTLGVPMLVTRQYPKGLGDTAEPIRTLTGGATVLDKLTFSCYADEEIRRAVDALGRKTILLCGIETHICVLQTMTDLKAAGYTPVLVEDCLSSRSRRDHETALLRAAHEGVAVTSCESVLFELLGAAGSEQFKKISKLVK